MNDDINNRLSQQEKLNKFISEMNVFSQHKKAMNELKIKLKKLKNGKRSRF